MCYSVWYFVCFSNIAFSCHAKRQLALHARKINVIKSWRINEMERNTHTYIWLCAHTHTHTHTHTHSHTHTRWGDGDKTGSQMSILITHAGQTVFMTLPFEMSQMRWIQSHFLIAAYFWREHPFPRFRVFSKSSCPVFFAEEIMLLYTKDIYKRHWKVFQTGTYLLVTKDCMMKTLFADFSKWKAVVVVTSSCYNNKISELILIMSASLEGELCAV